MGKEARIRRERFEREMEARARATGQRVQRISFEGDDYLQIDLVRSDLRAAVAPVVVRSPSGLRPLGTAFCLTAGLPFEKAIYATARHVVEGIIPALGEGFHEAPTRDGQEPFLLLPVQVSGAEDSSSLRGVCVEQFGTAEDLSDIAVMRVDLSEFSIPATAAVKFPVTLSEPAVGETCIALGYPGMRVGEQAPDDPDTSDWNGPLHASQAKIQEIHAAGRDRGMLPFPCFRTDAYFAPGMSGGPIVRQDGRVVGVVSAGYERAQRTAYGAIMGGIIRTGVRLLNNEGEPVDLTFPNLIAHRLVDVDDATVTWNGSGLEWSSRSPSVPADLSPDVTMATAPGSGPSSEGSGTPGT